MTRSRIPLRVVSIAVMFSRMLLLSQTPESDLYNCCELIHERDSGVERYESDSDYAYMTTDDD